MDALEFLNIILPEHDRTSCSDNDTQNGFWSMYGITDDKNTWQGRCRRCMSLEIIREELSVPSDLRDLADNII